jgi:pre-mRNA-splicing factor ATP-dependent RNA helicase DHX38/PRP16
LRFIRDREDRSKMRVKFWELAGSQLGNLLKVGKEAEKEETKVITASENGGATSQNKDGGDDDINYKADSQYADALKKKNEAVSDFAKSKTLKE